MEVKTDWNYTTTLHLPSWHVQGNLQVFTVLNKQIHGKGIWP